MRISKFFSKKKETYNILLNRKLEEVPSSPTGTLVRHLPSQSDLRPPPSRGPTYDVPLEILLKIFESLVPPRVREDVRTLLALTHVCRSWREILISTPKAWTTIFATQQDCRSMVEMCLERSHPASLEVTLDAQNRALAQSSCTCDKDGQSRLVPNRVKPCEWHFVFESLTKPEHSGRIQTLKIRYFDSELVYCGVAVSLALKSCRFFELPHLQLTSLDWEDISPENPDFVFPYSLFPTTLRSLSFRGSSGRNRLRDIRYLTSFTFTGLGRTVDIESFRTTILNNRSLETLSLDYIKFKGSLENEHPTTLWNLKSFSLHYTRSNSVKILSALIHIPCFERFSSLLISVKMDFEGTYWFTLHAARNPITFTVDCDPGSVVETWRGFTGCPGPTIERVCFENPARNNCGCFEMDASQMIPLLVEARTLEIGNGFTCHYHGSAFLCFDFWGALKERGPLLTNIRFEIPDKAEECQGMALMGDVDPQGERLFDAIEELVKHRSDNGWPFSSVERMVVSGNEEVDREREVIWRDFYDRRRLDQYVRRDL